VIDQPEPAPDQDAAEIRTQWLQEAQQTGVSDTFTSKRQQPRYTWRAQLDVRLRTATGLADPLIAQARDISETGLMFFCRDRIAPSSKGEVSLASESKSVPILFRHCTQTLGGYLIGADFVDQPD